MIQKRQQSSETGFTLIEVLVVVAILGILAGVVMPSVGIYTSAADDESGGTELHNVRTALTAMMADSECGTVTNPVATLTKDLSSCSIVAYSVTYPLSDYLSGANDMAYYYTISGSGNVTQSSTP